MVSFQISRLDSQRLVIPDVYTWQLHTGLGKFAQNISTNILSLGTRRDPNMIPNRKQSEKTNQIWGFPVEYMATKTNELKFTILLT